MGNDALLSESTNQRVVPVFRRARDCLFQEPHGRRAGSRKPHGAIPRRGRIPVRGERTLRTGSHRLHPHGSRQQHLSMGDEPHDNTRPRTRTGDGDTIPQIHAKRRQAFRRDLRIPGRRKIPRKLRLLRRGDTPLPGESCEIHRRLRGHPDPHHRGCRSGAGQGLHRRRVEVRRTRFGRNEGILPMVFNGVYRILLRELEGSRILWRSRPRLGTLDHSHARDSGAECQHRIRLRGDHQCLQDRRNKKPRGSQSGPLLYN
mmetsp:Transcript_2828/g.6304  ORF Transcript_2828/g.6304 Transcript_2828/m.6304 type:complete len:259 (-) Transcript_2828:2158-2934(-)